jgi:hypothetical protein
MAIATVLTPFADAMRTPVAAELIFDAALDGVCRSCLRTCADSGDLCSGGLGDSGGVIVFGGSSNDQYGQTFSARLLLISNSKISQVFLLLLHLNYLIEGT